MFGGGRVTRPGHAASVCAPRGAMHSARPSLNARLGGMQFLSALRHSCDGPVDYASQQRQRCALARHYQHPVVDDHCLRDLWLAFSHLLIGAHPQRASSSSVAHAQADTFPVHIEHRSTSSTHHLDRSSFPSTTRPPLARTGVVVAISDDTKCQIYLEKGRPKRVKSPNVVDHSSLVACAPQPPSGLISGISAQRDDTSNWWSNRGQRDRFYQHVYNPT